MMKKLNIVAVGSSPLVAGEICGITSSFLAIEQKITQAVTKDIEKAEPDTFYVCANTQGNKLAKTIPADKLYVFELTPTTRFFLDIAKIPAGETVYVFNNLCEYAYLLAERCKNLGINYLRFEPIAYEEMAEHLVIDKLKQAKYIIGVDVFVGKNILQAGVYGKYLRDDINIISGRRTASVKSANKLLAAIADYYYDCLAKEIQLKGKYSDKQIADLSNYIQKIIYGLQRSVLQTVTTQVVGSVSGGGLTSETEMPEPLLTGNSHQDCLIIQEQLRQFEFLKKKIHDLAI